MNTANTEKNIKNIRTKMVLVTPKMANKWLGKNTGNRQLREGVVDKLASDMSSGKWMLTHQGIAFNCDGTLLDGQHRLHAVVESSTSQWMPVTVGLPRESVSAIDDNLKRTVCDSLRIVHGIEIPNMTRAVAAAAYLGTDGGNSTKAYSSRQEQIKTFQKHQKAIAWAISKYPTTQRGLCKASVLGVIARAYYTQDHAKLERFAAALVDSAVAVTAAERSVSKLRDWLIQKSSGGAMGLKESYLKTERALKTFLDGTPITKLYEASEELFPIPGDKKVAG